MSLAASQIRHLANLVSAMTAHVGVLLGQT